MFMLSIAINRAESGASRRQGGGGSLGFYLFVKYSTLSENAGKN